MQDENKLLHFRAIVEFINGEYFINIGIKYGPLFNLHVQYRSMGMETFLLYCSIQFKEQFHTISLYVM